MKKSAALVWFIIVMALYAFFCTETSAQVETPSGTQIRSEPAATNTNAPTVGANPAIIGTRPGRVERRYKVEAVGFKCLDETWYDSPFFAPWISDEVMVILRDPQRRVLTVSRVFDDVDTNETRNFGPQENCILPINDQQDQYLQAPGHSWTCGAAGVSSPFTFSVEMYEEDLDLELGFQIPPNKYDEDSSIFTKSDELIGRRTLAFPAEELAAAMPNVNDTVEETIKLGACYDDEGREGGCVETPIWPTGPEYTFTYRLTRLPDVTQEPVINPNP